jgi:hypothetical protein
MFAAPAPAALPSPAPPAAARAAALDLACAATTRRLFLRYVDAYTKGATRTLDRTFAPVSTFQWYSSRTPGRRLGAAARDRGTLVRYFAARHRAGDTLQLKTFQLNGTDAGRHLGHFEFTARRRAHDYRGGRWFTVSGKGAARCDQRRIVVLSLG